MTADSNRPAATALDAIIPTNPFAALSCWIGIGSVVLCGFGVLLGPIAIVLGWLGLMATALYAPLVISIGCFARVFWKV